MTTEEQLAEYAKKLGISYFTLEMLIKSHEFLRKENTERVKVLNEDREKAAKLGERSAYETAVKLNWFSKERLQQMTLGELAVYLREDD